MYLKKIRLSNFRKYDKLEVEFKNGLNVLIGENDSGKSAIVDAIKYLLNTKSYEQIRFDPKDFFKKDKNAEREDNFEIEGIITGFKDSEAGNFLEWGYFNKEKEFELRLYLKANLQTNNRIIWDLKAGPENAENQLDGNARDLLRLTYLKPLRDAENELTPGYRSRLAQILLSLQAFEKVKDDEGKIKKHKLEEIIENANKEILEFLKEVPAQKNDDSKNILEQINEYISYFLHINDNRKAELKIADPELCRILRSLSLKLEENTSGLGTLNSLFMATELLHLETDPLNSLRLALIEELEAHLHPQAQLRVINSLKEIENSQFIITTHSTILGSSINLDSLILCKDNDIFPMWKGKTELVDGDYKFLQRFLDSTKSNLFFAKGIIMVEGDAENILIPTIANIIGKPLYKFGVSIVNVGSTAFLRYTKIFMRKDEKKLNIPVSVITDLDVRAIEYYTDSGKAKPEFIIVPEKEISVADKIYDISKIRNNYYFNKDELKDSIKNTLNATSMPNGVNSVIDNWDKEELSDSNIEDIRKARKKTLESKFSYPVKAYVNENWTLEYDISLSSFLREYFAQSVLIAQKIKNSERYFTNIYDTKGKLQIPENIQEEAASLCKMGTDEEIAYNIFKPFLTDNKPSKTVTAQVFADILKHSENVNKEDIINDNYLKYIINAINYACGIEE